MPRFTGCCFRVESLYMLLSAVLARRFFGVKVKGRGGDFVVEKIRPFRADPKCRVANEARRGWVEIFGTAKYYPDLYFYTKKNKMSVEPFGRRNKGC